MIVDHRGKPIERAPLLESQSARLVHLHREFATHPSRGLTPQGLAAILEDAELGLITAQHDLFADMEEKDGHIMAEMGKRKRALLCVPWSVEPPPSASAAEIRATDAVKDLLAAIPDFEDVILDAADAIGHGFSVQELSWTRTGSMWVPWKVDFRPQSWFMTPQDSRNELRLRNNTPDGEELRPFGWIVHVHRARSGYLARAGLHRTLAWPYLFKNYAIRDLAELLEIYGLPIRIGTYPRNAGDREKATLMQALVSLGHNAAGIIPEGMKIDFEDVAKTGGGDPFKSMVEWCERTESKVIVGQTLTSQTDGGGGAYALGKVHQDVMWDLTLSDCRQVASTLTRALLWPLCALNLSGVNDPSRSPRFCFDTQEAEDLKIYADALPPLVGAGVKIPEKWVREKLRIPEAEEGELLLQTAAAAPPAVPPSLTALTAKAEDDPTPDFVDDLVARLEADSAQVMDELIGGIRGMAERAGTVEEFQAALVAAYPSGVTNRLAAVIGDALAAAELGGRFAVRQENDG